MASDKGKKSAKTVTAIPANDDGTEKKRALDIALAGIEKQFGKGAVIRMGERAVRDIQVIPTGCLDLDMALGVGGVPRGRVVEIYGPESSGKTTLALHVLAEAQKMGGVAAFIDAEHALDPVYARKLGVDVDQLYVSQPDTGEQALEICEALVRSGAIDVVVIDSVAALVPKAEIDGEMGDSFVGLQARLMSQALRKLTGIINKTNSTCIFINQLREKVGVMYGNPETTPGGHPPRRAAQGRHNRRRQPHEGEDRQEQGRAAVQNRGVRYSLRRGHQQGRQPAGQRGCAGYHPQIRRVVLLRRPAHRSGPREHPQVPQGERGNRRGNRQARSRRADGQGCARRAERGG